MGFGNVIDLLRRVDQLLKLEEKHGKVIATLQTDIDALRVSVTRLEASEEIIVVEAKAAAGAAAIQVAVASVADIAPQVGALEERGSRGTRSTKQIRSSQVPAFARPRLRFVTDPSGVVGVAGDATRFGGVKIA